MAISKLSCNVCRAVAIMMQQTGHWTLIGLRSANGTRSHTGSACLFLSETSRPCGVCVDFFQPDNQGGHARVFVHACASERLAAYGRSQSSVWPPKDEVSARTNKGLPSRTGSGGAAERERALPL